jgi:hypothetical protein
VKSGGEKVQNKDCVSYCHPFFEIHHGGRRRFLTKEEKTELKKIYKEKKIKWLKHYRESLEKEVTGVDERIEELEKEE